ncbi:MAG: inositol monophosphatase [Bacteroidales bacterium]|nr:inositol monophosphatase [Bacteroidales bacterium]
MNNNPNLEALTFQVIQLAKTITIYLKDEMNAFGNEAIEIKGLHNFVTYVDKIAEKKIIAALAEILPEAGFIAEETQDTKKGERYNWVIDPLDGTTNYIHGVPVFSVSIALLDGNEVVVGVVHEAVRDECFYAWKGGPAFLNGKTMKVSTAGKLNDSLMATGFPYYDYSKLDPYLKIFRHLMENTHGIRRLGSAAVDLAYVACGRFEGFYEYGLNSWDVAAGALIVKQASGKVTDFNGGTNFLFGREIIATNRLIHDEFLGIVKKYFCNSW